MTYQSANLSALEREVEPRDVVLIHTAERIFVAMQATHIVNEPYSKSQPLFEEQDDVQKGNKRELYLSPVFSDSKDTSRGDDAYIDLNTKEIWGHYLSRNGRSLGFQLPLHYTDSEIVKKATARESYEKVRKS